MGAIDIGDCAMAGVRLTARKPLCVLIWGLIVVGYCVLMLTLFGDPLLATIAALAGSQGDTRPELVLVLLGNIFGLLLVLWLGLTVIGAVIMGAALRAELEPGSHRFAYMRLGAPELWLIAVNFVLSVVLLIVSLVIGIPLGIVAFAVGLASFGPGHGFEPAAWGGALASTIGIRVVGQLVIAAVNIWLWCRLCMGPVMSFRERQFRLFESWTLTRGHAWPIFLVMLVVFAFLLALWILIQILGGAAVIGTAVSIAGIGDRWAFFSRPSGEWIGLFGPALAFVAVLMVILTGVGNAMTWTAVGRIYRQLVPTSESTAILA